MIMGTWAEMRGALPGAGSQVGPGNVRPSITGASRISAPACPCWSARHACNSSFAAMERNRARSWRPIPSRASSCPASSVAASGGVARSIEPLSTIARWNSPCAAGIAISVLILAPPPDSPNTVTLPGSPPKAAMFSRTHWSAAIRSSWPTFPRA